MSDNTKNIMTIEHPQWNRFFVNLVGRLDFQNDGYGNVSFDCDGTFDEAMFAMLEISPSINITESITYFKDNHATCDCEILFNVPAGKETTTHEAEKAIQES